MGYKPKSDICLLTERLSRIGVYTEEHKSHALLLKLSDAIDLKLKLANSLNQPLNLFREL
jgi:hypothetical protein